MKKEELKKTDVKKKSVSKIKKGDPVRRTSGKFKKGQKTIHRPSKLTEQFCDKLEEILSIGIRAIIYTNEEALDSINEMLPEKDRMSMTTFNEHRRRIANSSKDLTELEKRFSSTIKRLLRNQKEGLFAKLGGDDKNWTRWAWIIERKFDEWNLRIKHQEVLDDEYNEVKKMLLKLKEETDV